VSGTGQGKVAGQVGEIEASEGDHGDRQSLVDVIRAAIRDGRYHPRERLVEADLADEYGVKRSVVRAALMELTAEGLVERQPNRGARVRQVSVEEAMEITEVRLSLQAMCAAKAAVSGTDEDREWLLQEINVLRSAVARNEREAYIAANSQIFARIREMGGHSTANRLIQQLANQNPSQRYPYALADRRLESLTEFERIVDAVVARDADAAYAATIAHRENVLAALREIQAQAQVQDVGAF
jgi:DNA-binding GntR family transcriptional regulator